MKRFLGVATLALTMSAVTGMSTPQHTTGYLVASGLRGTLLCRDGGVDYDSYTADEQVEGAACTPTTAHVTTSAVSTTLKTFDTGTFVNGFKKQCKLTGGGVVEEGGFTCDDGQCDTDGEPCTTLTAPVAPTTTSQSTGGHGTNVIPVAAHVGGGEYHGGFTPVCRYPDGMELTGGITCDDGVCDSDGEPCDARKSDD